MKISKKIIERFENYLVEQEKSTATIEKYMRDVTKLCVFLQGGEATKTKVLEYKNNLIEKYAPASVNSILASVNSFFDFCQRADLKIKSIKLQRKMFINKEKELSKDEYKRLLHAAKSKSA